MSEMHPRTAIPLPFVKRTPPAFSRGTVGTPSGKVFRIATAWSRQDRWGAFRSRVSAYRMTYAVAPGLYAVGDPGPGSPVFVSASYKLSFDVLRRSLDGIDGWVLVLDTKGINVWCAAGKGTFGTDELVRRIRDAGLEQVVSHRRLIVPQLGAPGVSAAAVARETGFRVAYGPVEARDLKAYLAAGGKASPEMRTVRFTLADRLVLTPMEVLPAARKYPAFAAVVLLTMGLQPSGILFRDAWQHGWPLLLQGLAAVLAGAIVTPALLPWVPGRSFAVKGWLVGLVTAWLLGRIAAPPAGSTAVLVTTVMLLFFPLLSSYIALQFTGSTTFTSMSGTKKELRLFLPVYLAGVAATVVLLAAIKVKEWQLL